MQGCQCRSVIEESEDQDVSRMQAKMNFVSIDQLAPYVNNKVSTPSPPPLWGKCAPYL